MPDATQFRHVDTATDGKEIRSITMRRVGDSDPDLSYLGEYSDSPGEHAINVFGPEQGDEAQCNLCDMESPILFHDGEWHHGTFRVIRDEDDFDHDPVPDDNYCGGRSYQAGKYRYFNPSSRADGLPEDEAATCRYADFQRMESYNQQEWQMVGVYAQASIVVAGIIQTVQSGGLWGIESDSDGSYFAEIEAEQLSELVTVLEELGFERTAIDEACADVTDASD
jgi:hypothetical protein